MKIDLNKTNGSSPADKATIEDEVLTLEEAGQILKLTKNQVYSLTRARGQQRAKHPFPVFTIHTSQVRILNAVLTAQRRCWENRKS